MIDAALLLPKILARTGDNAELTETAVKVAWRRAAGEGLREHAVPFRLQDKTLIVSVADAVWQKQLRTMSAELIFRINNLLQRKLVEAIEFRVNPRLLGRHKTLPDKQRRVTAPLPNTIVTSAAEIQDSELRERFMRAAENCIARREGLNASTRGNQSKILKSQI